MKHIDDGIYLYEGTQAGNTVAIMVGVHGNEYIPVRALKQLSMTFSISSGKVFFIFANLEAMKRNVRYYQKNLNRCFLPNATGDTYEDLRAKTIMQYLDTCDYLLDLHNTCSKNSSYEFLISEHKEYDDLFDVPYVVSGFNVLHPGGSDSYMNGLGKKGFCLEVGSLYDRKREKYLISSTQKSIANFLAYTGNLEQEVIHYPLKKKIHFSYIYKNNSDKFSFQRNYEDFEYIPKGNLIAWDDEKKVYAPYDGYILFAHTPKQTGEECFCFGEMV